MVDLFGLFYRKYESMSNCSLTGSRVGLEP